MSALRRCSLLFLLTLLVVPIIPALAPALLALPGQPLRFIPVTPCRSYDTRNTTPIAGGTSRDFVVPGTCGVPGTAAALSLNVAVVPHGSLGFLTVWPAGSQQPTVATLNSLDGRIKSNAAIVPTGQNGAISIFASMSPDSSTDVVLDVNGYFVPATDSAALAFYPLTPCRVVDTRNPNGPLGGPSFSAKQTRDFPILQSQCGIPPTAQAYSMNFAAIPSGPLGYLTAWPADKTRPVVATLNALTGTITSNAAIVPAAQSAGPDFSIGDIKVYADAATGLVIDVNGYFAPPTSGGQSLFTLAPCRVLDTRKTTGFFSGQLNPPVDVQASPCAVSSAGAYVFNATVVPHGPLGYLTLWPDGIARPLAATLNALDGAITNNMAIVPTANGSIDAYASGSTNLILDISSYFAPSSDLSVFTSTLPSGVVNTPYVGVLVATGGTPPYSWRVTQGALPTGLSLDANLGFISGTPTVAGESNFSVQVTDAAGSTAPAALSLSINSESGFSVTTKGLPVGTQNAAYASPALAASGGVAPYTWTVVAGALPAGLTLNPTSALITGTPQVTGSFVFVVEAKDQNGSLAFGILDVIVNSGTGNSLISGSYAFNFSDYNASQQPTLAVGSFSGDGKGGIVSGTLDTNSAEQGIHTNAAITGSYSVNSNGTGAMSITSGLQTLDFAVAASTSGDIRFIQYLRPDFSGSSGAGVIRKQNSADFGLSRLKGPYASGLGGLDSGSNRFASASQFQLDGAGNLTQGAGDVNDNGVFQPDTFFGTLSGVDSNTGRGTASLTSALWGQLQYVFYVVSKNDLLLLSTDTSGKPLVSGSASAQSTTSFSNTSLQGNSILQVEGVGQSNGSVVSDTSAGILAADGNGNAQLSLDENRGGTLSQQKYSGNYSVAPNGRVTLTNFGAQPPIFYMVSPNRAFVLGTDNGVTTGNFEPQSGAPFTDSSFAGSYVGASGPPFVPASTDNTVLAQADGKGNVNVTIFTDFMQDQILPATYTVDSSGRIPILGTGASGAVAYVISPTKVVVITADPAGTLIVLER